MKGEVTLRVLASWIALLLGAPACAVADGCRPLRQHLTDAQTAYAAYRDFVLSAETSRASDALARAWSLLGLGVDDVRDCDRDPLQQRYFSLTFELENVQFESSDDDVFKRDKAQEMRDTLEILFEAGFAKASPQTYAADKQVLLDAYAEVHLRFVPFEERP